MSHALSMADPPCYRISRHGVRTQSSRVSSKAKSIPLTTKNSNARGNKILQSDLTLQCGPWGFVLSHDNDLDRVQQNRALHEPSPIAVARIQPRNFCFISTQPSPPYTSEKVETLSRIKALIHSNASASTSLL